MAISDETFGGVIIERPDPQVIVAIASRPGPPGPSGYSGFSGTGGGGGGGGSGPGTSGFSGYSGRSGPGGAAGSSGFSGFSSRSGFSGYSGINVSGYSGFSGASGLSGASGPGGGNSGYSGYSGKDGTFSASGFSGFSGFSARSGFSGYSGSGFSGYSGFSGFGQSGFSGFSGPATSGFSGFSGPSTSGFSGFSGKSGFSGGPSGFSGFSGTGSPPGSPALSFQYNNAAGAYAGQASLVSDGANNTFATATRFFFQDPVDTTKTARMDVSSLPPASNVIVTVSGQSVTVQPNPASANQFVTGITSAGVVQKAQPDFNNLTGLATFSQLDRTTVVVSETTTLTLNVNTRTKSSATGILATIAFSGGTLASQARRLSLDVTGGPYVLNIPACRRLGDTATITTISVPAGFHEFLWEYIGAEYILSDSVPSTSSGTGTSGFSGFSGRSGYSGFSGAGTSGFSGFSGPAGAGSSGFSGFSGPSVILFSTKTDTDYTLALVDANTGVKMTSAVAHNLTVPNNASVAFPIGTQIAVEQGGSALVSFVPGAGVTLQGATVTSGQFSVCVLIKQAADTWLISRSGTSGFSGYSGPSGVSGYSGGAGGAGSAGSSGFSGFSGGGPSGFSGFSGPGSSGFSGYSSLSGFSGRSGYSAYSGYSGPQLLTFSTQTDTDYTLVLGDANTGVKMTSAVTRTLTVPLNSSVAFPIGTQIPIEQGGAGVISIAAAVGVTLQGANTTSGQYSMVVLIKQAADTWLAATGNSGYSGYSGGSGRSGYSAFSGYSGSGGWTTLTVASDTSTTGQVLVDVPDLVSGTLVNNSLYEIHAVLKVSVSSDTNGTAYGFHAGGSGTVGNVYVIIEGTSSVVGAIQFTVNAYDTSSQTFMVAAGATGIVHARGFFTTRSTGTATISMQHRKLVSGTSTVFTGSYVEYRLA